MPQVFMRNRIMNHLLWDSRAAFHKAMPFHTILQTINMNMIAKSIASFLRIISMMAIVTKV